MNSPYVYCNANPVKYVDPDGNAPWENENIRDARKFVATSEPGYEVRLVDGTYGQDAQVVHTSTGKVVYEKVATPSNQRTAIGNICSPGHADGFNIGTTTKQDVAVATGVIGVITGGMSLVAGTSVTGAIVTVSGMANSFDDIGTDANGESFVQQQVNAQYGKVAVGITKTIVSGLGIKNDINTIMDAGSSIIQKTISVVDSFNSFVNNLNALFNE